MFKDKIKELRIANHLTQEQLAEKLFVSRSAVAKWEQGRGIPKYDTVKDIATLFSVPIETFYEQDAAQEVIQVIEKDNKKKTIILFSIIAALLISLTSSLIYAFSKKEFKPYSEYNTFLETSTLKKLSLQNMKGVDNNNYSRVNYCSENLIDYYSFLFPPFYSLFLYLKSLFYLIHLNLFVFRHCLPILFLYIQAPYILTILLFDGAINSPC